MLHSILIPTPAKMVSEGSNIFITSKRKGIKEQPKFMAESQLGKGEEKEMSELFRVFMWKKESHLAAPARIMKATVEVSWWEHSENNYH